MMIPKPFSKIYCMTGIPIEVPKDPNRTQLALVTQQIQAEMDRLSALGDRLAAGEDIPIQELLSKREVRAAA